MLANGATLEYKSKSVTSFAKLKGLKEIPEIGVDPEKVDNTDLEASQKVYEWELETQETSLTNSNMKILKLTVHIVF